MSGPAIMRALLMASPEVQAIVGNRIFAGVLPQGTLLPAVGIEEISSNDMDTVTRDFHSDLVTCRVQVTVLTRSYAAQKALLRACKLRGANTGTVAGFKVCGVQSIGAGPDMPVEDDGIYEQSRDFMILFIEDN